MENASKALIMAAGVLIGILVISLAVYLFATFGAQSLEMHKQVEATRLNEFNVQFTSYIGKEDITIYDVVTVANLASESNIYYELTKDNNKKETYYVSVTLDSLNKVERIENSYGDSKDNVYYNNIIKDNMFYPSTTDLTKYTCQVDISDITGRVYKVYFKKIKK